MKLRSWQIEHLDRETQRITSFYNPPPPTILGRGAIWASQQWVYLVEILGTLA